MATPAQTQDRHTTEAKTRGKSPLARIVGDLHGAQFFELLAIVLNTDVRIARPASTEVINFADGQRARFFDFVLVAPAVHGQLLACQAGRGTCSPSSPGAVTFVVDVT